MNILYFFLAFIIPSLSIVTISFGYRYYVLQNKHADIVLKLHENNNQILSDKKEIFVPKKKNWLRKTLGYAGFYKPSALIVFCLISVSLGIIDVISMSFIINSKIILGVMFILSCLTPLLVLKTIINFREEDFNFGLKIIIDKTSSMMKSGIGFEQSLKKAIVTSRSKLTKEIFNIYLNEKDIIGEEKCFNKMFERIESKELRIFYLVISIGKQSGGKFSNTLDKLRQSISSQEEIKQQIKSSTREVRIGSYMIVGLVFFIYIMINDALNGILNEHFLQTEKGNIQLFFIVVWILIGLFVNKSLAKVK